MHLRGSARWVAMGAALLVVGALGPGDRAWAQDDEPENGLRAPEQLTVGGSNEFLGQLGPDGKTIWFVSNRNTTTEIYKQDTLAGRALLAFDEGADVTWPRLSPDGKRLLYISYRDEAAGQLCVRTLPGLEERSRVCLSDGITAMQAQWIDARRIALVGRRSVEGDLALVEVALGRRLATRPLGPRNLTSPALSPDGRWLIYVPVERYADRVGPAFAARAARRLEAVRLDRPAAPPVPFELDLPGSSGQPAFSLDGKWLYVAQFFSDSNHDGVIDGDDHGVLFRVPFEPQTDDAPLRAARAFAEQLTDSTWNCQYPSPAPDRVIATCARFGANLEIHSLPLDGAVPREWTRERVATEIDLASRRIEQLLLYRHLLAKETAPTARRAAMMSLIRLHLAFDELDAAAYYARKVPALKDPATRGLSKALPILIEHRRALRGREHGRTGLDFGAEERQRFEALTLDDAPTPTALQLRHIVRSEIAETLGDFTVARQELEAIDVPALELPSLFAYYYERADALYRLLDDREALVATLRRLAEHPKLDADGQLRFARAAVRAMVRGLPLDEAVALLARERTAAAPASELAFALELQAALLAMRDAHPKQATIDALKALYQAQPRIGRKRALMVDAVERADELDAERPIEALVELYIGDVPRGTAEFRRADRLYRRAIQGRAYRRLSQGRTKEALDDFARVARVTGALESHLAYMDVRMRQGAKPDELRAEIEQIDATRTEESRAALGAFVHGYLRALSLPSLSGDAHRQEADDIIKALRAQWPALKKQRAAQALYGSVLHERVVEAHDLRAAERANNRYGIALQLVGANPRYRAMVLGQLALLQAQVGNWHIALDYLTLREKLPFVEDREANAAAAGSRFQRKEDAIIDPRGLVHRFVKARTLFHLDRLDEAAQVADEALALVDKTAAFAEYRPLVLDRAALYNLAAGRFSRAVALYDTELPVLAAATGADAERNRLVARLGRAAAAVGAGQPQRALEDLAWVDGHLDDPALRPLLTWPHATSDEVLRAYHLIAAGLRAKATRRLGDLAAAAAALEHRRALAEERFAHSHLDEHLRALALVEEQLAEVAHERGDRAAAATWLERALGHADSYVQRTGVPASAEQLDLLWLAAELRLSSGTTPRFDLDARLRNAYQKLVKERDPSFRAHTRWLELYLALTDGKR